jgi:hypothetical protein
LLDLFISFWEKNFRVQPPASPQRSPCNIHFCTPHPVPGAPIPLSLEFHQEYLPETATKSISLPRSRLARRLERAISPVPNRTVR